MITITVQNNLARDIDKFLGKTRKQALFATAVALTHSAKQAAQDVQTALPEVLDRPTPFTVKSIGWKSANKATLTSVVYIRPVAAAYLVPLITGGRVTPKKRALLEPGAIALNRYGNIPRNAIAHLRARKDVWSGEVRGIPGLWQRTGRGLKLLVRYEREMEKRKQFPFAALVQKSVDRHFDKFFAAAWQQALATAR